MNPSIEAGGKDDVVAVVSRILDVRNVPFNAPRQDGKLPASAITDRILRRSGATAPAPSFQSAL